QQNHIYDTALTGLAGPTLPTNTYVMSATAGASSAPSRNGIVVTGLPAVITSPMTFGCKLSGSANGSTDGEWIAMNYSYWLDAAAYAAWAGLRPYTELEYEKAARGPITPVNGEYAWGSTGITNATGPSNS